MNLKIRGKMSRWHNESIMAMRLRRFRATQERLYAMERRKQKLLETIKKCFEMQRAWKNQKENKVVSTLQGLHLMGREPISTSKNTARRYSKLQ